MGRKRNGDDTPMLPGMEEPLPPAASPAPKPRARTKPVWPRLIAGTFATIIGVSAAISFLYRAEQFLISDPRFALDDADNSIVIAGAEHASRRAIAAVFAEDANRSLYLVPVNERRMMLKSVDWIRDATVARIWPNRLVIQVSERKPVAFLTLSAGRIGLIDEDGVILPQAQDRFALPVVTGVRASDALHERRERIARLLRFTKEVGEPSKDISEIDVADRDNLKVRQPYEGHVVTLLLGDSHFLLRYQNFLTHYAEIKRKLPDAATLDLRLEDRITVVE